MYLLLRNNAGLRRECVLLAATADRIRLTVQGCADAVELTREQGCWMWEGLEPVKVEFAMAERESDWEYCALEAPATGEPDRSYVMAV